MNQTYRVMYTIEQLINDIYNDNLAHFDDRNTSDDCDCHIHITLNTMIKYMEAIEC
jgi:hypothetical protein